MSDEKPYQPCSDRIGDLARLLDKSQDRLREAVKECRIADAKFTQCADEVRRLEEQIHLERTGQESKPEPSER